MPAPAANPYTHGHSEAVLASHAWRTAENSAAYLLAALHPADRVLDVGCGVGTITLGLGRHVPDGSVIGVDLEREVFPQAAGNVSFRQADLFHLPFDDGAFDVTHAHQVLQHLADPVAALREMARVTRPGGLVAARDADYSAFSYSPASLGVGRFLTLYREVARANGGEPDAAPRLVGWARQAGLAQVAATASAWCYTGDEAIHWAETWAERAETSAVATRAIELDLATPEALAEMASAWRAWADEPSACFLVPNGEILATV